MTYMDHFHTRKGIFMKITKGTLLKIGIGVFLLFLAIRHWADILGLAGTVLSAAMPLLIGCIIAYPVNILMSWFEKHWFPYTRKKLLVSLSLDAFFAP